MLSPIGQTIHPSETLTTGVKNMKNIKFIIIGAVLLILSYFLFFKKDYSVYHEAKEDCRINEREMLDKLILLVKENPTEDYFEVYQKSKCHINLINYNLKYGILSFATDNDGFNRYLYVSKMQLYMIRNNNDILDSLYKDKSYKIPVDMTKYLRSSYLIFSE